MGTAESFIEVPIPHTAAQIAALQKTAEADAAEVVALVVVDSPETYTAADEILTELAQRKAGAVAMRKSATVPMYQAIRVVEGWFRPYVAALDTGIGHIKASMSAFRVAQDATERAARADALAAAEAGGDGVKLIESLTLAEEASQKPDGRASCAFGWKVARIVEDLLPDEWWTPDLAKIDVVAKSADGDELPVIPGVVFERVAKIGARK